MDKRPNGRGIPIEEAPLWVLAIFTVLLWLVVFPGLVGLLDVIGRFDGNLRHAALWAVAGTGALVLALVIRKSWRRSTPRHPADERPLAVHFSTWLITALVVPNVIYGLLIISRGGQSLDPFGAYLLWLIISTVHGAFALFDRFKRRSDRR